MNSGNNIEDNYNYDELNETVIIVSGKITNYFIENSSTVFFNSFKDIKNKILTTWDYEKDKAQMFKDNGFDIVYSSESEMPEVNPYYQFLPVEKALKYAKEKGFKYALRTRTDIITLNYKKYLYHTRDIHKKKMSALFGLGILNQNTGPYFLDVIVGGPIDNLLKLFKMTNKTVRTPPDRDAIVEDFHYAEGYLLEQWFNYKTPSAQDVKSILEFTYNICIKNNIEFIWKRKERWLPRFVYNNFPYLRIISEYYVRAKAQHSPWL